MSAITKHQLANIAPFLKRAEQIRDTLTVLLSGVNAARNEGNHRNEVDVIKAVVADFFDVPASRFTGSRGKDRISSARMVAMFFSSELTDGGVVAIGEAFGRNHTTVSHARHAVRNRIETDQKFEKSIVQLREKIKIRLEKISAADVPEAR